MPNGLKIVLRFLWFFISRILIWAAAVGIVVLAFFMAMDYMNARILTSDGLQARAEVIIMADDPTPLSKVFSKGFLEKDDLLSSNLYRQYLITDIDYDIDLGISLIFPWDDTATIRVTELVTNIDGEIIIGTDTNENISVTPPAWDHATYDITLARYEDNWRVVNMELVELLPQPEPDPTPTPSATPSPTPSPTPISSPLSDEGPTEENAVPTDIEE